MWLAFVFLFGFAACYPYGSPKEASHEDILAFVTDVQEALDLPYTEYDDDGTKTELGKILKERLDHVLEKIKEAVDKGKEVSQNLKDEVTKITEKLKDLKEDIGNKARDFFERIKEKAKDKFREWLEKIGWDKKSGNEFAYTDDDKPKTELGKKLREQLDDVLEKIKDAVDKGKTIRDELREKVKHIKEKLKELKENIGEKAREMLKNIREKVKDKMREILEKLGLKDKDDEFAYAEFADDGEPQTELGKKLREHLDHILEKIKDAIEHGKGIREDLAEKVKEIREKLKDMKVSIGEKAKELLNRIKEKSKDFLGKLLERIGLKDVTTDNEEILYTEFDEEEPDQLKKTFDDILEKIKDAIEKGKSIKADLLKKFRELKEKLEARKIDLGNKAREIMENIKERIKNWLKEMLNKEFSDTYDDIDEMAVLRRIFHMIESDASTEDIEEYIKKELRDAPLGEALLQTLRQGRKPLRLVVKALLGIRDSRSISDVYERIKDYVKGLKEKFGNFLDWVKDTYSKGKEASKDKIENIKDVAREFIKHVKDVKKEVAEEALEFFRPYKHDMGQLWEEVKKTVKDAIGH